MSPAYGLGLQVFDSMLRWLRNRAKTLQPQTSPLRSTSIPQFQSTMSSKRPHLRLPVDIHDALDAGITPLTPCTPGILGTCRTPGTPVESTAAELPNPHASRDMFFALSLYSPPEWESELSESGEPSPGSATELEHLVDSPREPIPPTEYDDAIARVNRLDGFLTPSMKPTPTCLLTVIQLHLSPPTLNGVPVIADPLITRVASQDEMPDHRMKDIVDIIEKGLLLFSALGGGSTGSVSGSATARPAIPLAKSAAHSVGAKSPTLFLTRLKTKKGSTVGSLWSSSAVPMLLRP